MIVILLDSVKYVSNREPKLFFKFGKDQKRKDILECHWGSASTSTRVVQPVTSAVQYY